MPLAAALLVAACATPRPPAIDTAPWTSGRLALRVEAVEEELSGEALEEAVSRLHDMGLPAKEIAARLKPRGAHRRDVYEALKRFGRDG